MDHKNYNQIIGIDEVGRGSLAGPVYLSGVLLGSTFPKFTSQFSLPQEYKNYQDFSNVRDSKKLSPFVRQKIYDLIIKYKIENTVLSASNILIDKYGIGVCLSHMVGLIIADLTLDNAKNTLVLIDGKIKLLPIFNLKLIQLLIEENGLNSTLDPTPTQIIQTLPHTNLQIIRENKADDKYLSIALASNLAKVKRDKLMTVLGETYPEFDWKTNKGYGTVKHRQSILKNPHNIYLRQSFLGKILSELP